MLEISFSLSFYMLFVHNVDGNMSWFCCIDMYTLKQHILLIQNDLKAFSTLGWALLATIVATTRDTNFDGIFVDTLLQYSPAAILLFPISSLS